MNRRVSDLVVAWQANGSPIQESFDWSVSLDNWVVKFPEHADFLRIVLPNPLNREDVRRICKDSSFTILEKFLSVMVWGYGDRGYGPYRVGIMLSQPHCRSVLSDAYLLASQGSPKSAYDFLSRNRIRILGPSFGTKFLSFSTPRDIGAPIYDSFIGLWVASFANEDFSGVSTNPENWNPKTYFAYWDWIKEHSDYYLCHPDEIELVLFQDAESTFGRKAKL
jgi:hypothetical protein